MITQQRLKQLLHYDPETGIFSWVETMRGGRNNAFVIHQAGDIAGGPSGWGYWKITVDKKQTSGHRLAWLYMTGALPSHDVDHINGERADNKWANLREATRSQNMENLKGPHKDNELGLLGVFRHRDKFAARIMKNGKSTNLGVFQTAESAHQAYIKAKRSTHERGTL